MSGGGVTDEFSRISLAGIIWFSLAFIYISKHIIICLDYKRCAGIRAGINLFDYACLVYRCDSYGANRLIIEEPI